MALTDVAALRRLSVGAAVAVVVPTLALAATSAWTHATASGRLFHAADVPRRDVAVIFGAQIYDDGTPAPFTRARLDLGARLWREGRVRVLLVSGDDSAAHNRETTSMRAYLVGLGVPDAVIVEDPKGVDTYDTCWRVSRVYGVTDPILVSQSYHLPRALTACGALGMDAVGVGDDSVRDLDFWPWGVAREVPAGLKLVRDVTLRRPAETVDPPTDAVARALAGR